MRESDTDGSRTKLMVRGIHKPTLESIGHGIMPVKNQKSVKRLIFCNTKFSIKKIEHPSTSYIKTIKESSHVRFKYYGTGTKFNGTIFAELKDKTIPDNTRFFVNTNIEETMDVLVSDGTFWQILFWIFWIVLTGAAVFGFYYLDNEWLE